MITRVTALAFALTAAFPVAGQVDTLRYFPLHQDDVWSYTRRLIEVPQGTDLTEYRSYRVVGDTTLAGTPFAVVAFDVSSVAGDTTQSCRFAARVEPGRGYLTQEPFGPCAEFPLMFDLKSADSSQAMGPGAFAVGKQHYEAEGRIVLRYEIANPFGMTLRGVAADVGTWDYSRFSRRIHTYSSDHYSLSYAVVGGVTYGEPVGGGPGPGPGAEPSIVTSPNPTRGPLTIRVAPATPSSVHLEAYDVMGRRVYEADLGIAWGGASVTTLDVSAWVPGLYVLRADSPGWSARTRVVVAR